MFKEGKMNEEVLYTLKRTASRMRESHMQQGWCSAGRRAGREKEGREMYVCLYIYKIALGDHIKHYEQLPLRGEPETRE